MGDTTRLWAPGPSNGGKRSAIEDVELGATKPKRHRPQPDHNRSMMDTTCDLTTLPWDTENQISYDAEEEAPIHQWELPHIDTSTWTPPKDPGSFTTLPDDLGSFDDNGLDFFEQENLLTSEASSISHHVDDTMGNCPKTPLPLADGAMLESIQSAGAISMPCSPCINDDNDHSRSWMYSSGLEKARYNICLGVIVANVISSFVPGQQNCTTPVQLRPWGNTFKLYLEDSGKYVGLLQLSWLGDFLQDFAVQLRANLAVDSVESSPKKAVKARKAERRAVSRQLSLRITVFGLQCQKAAIGQFLSAARTYLQHPSLSECEPGTEYCNPHYLLRPGDRLPQLEYLTVSPQSPVTKGAETLNETDKSKIMMMFDSAADFSVPEELAPSPRLQTTLKSHQLIALSMMIWKESGIVQDAPIPTIWELASQHDEPARYRHIITGQSQDTPTAVLGGCLADEMGLGKTLSILALICSSLDRHDDRRVRTAETPRATLIVTPKSTISGWLKNIKEHVRLGQLRSEVFHGSGRQRLSSMLEDMDVILTTYETLRSDWSAHGVLYAVKWSRVVLDEAHHIRNRSSQTYKAACAIHSQQRWCLTGTPIQNSLDDYGALLSFLRVPPFWDKSSFDFWIRRALTESNRGLKRLQDLIRTTCIRRTKKMLRDSCELPQRIERTAEVEMHQTDQELYNFFKERCSKIAKGKERTVSASPKDNLCKEDNVLSLINFLRLICDHGAALLPQSALHAWEAGDGRSVDWGMMRIPRNRCCTCDAAIEVADIVASDGFEADCGHSMCASCTLEVEDGKENSSSRCLKCPSTASHGIHRSHSVPIEAFVRPSAKVEALVRNLRAEQNSELFEMPLRPAKSVVFSHWTKMLDLIQQALRNQGFGFERIDGRSSLADRDKSITRFNDDATCTVLLASITAVGEGVDLTAANHVHLIEPHWNPMVEAQAVDRVHRIGQDRNVVITRYIVPKSVETYIQWVQKEKIKIIAQSIDSQKLSQTDMETFRWEKLIASFSS